MPPSAFDVVIDRVLTVVQGGRTREVTVDEALQQKTYHDAIAGSRMAQRAVFRMLAKREAALAAKQSPKHNLEVRFEGGDPSNANAAMLLLGIAERTDFRGAPQLQLASWAVEAALKRRTKAGLTEQELAEAKRNSLDRPAIRWPKARER